MAKCQGNLCVSTRVDRDMQEFLEAEARKYGINRAELFRRVLDTYRDSRREQVDCPHCDSTVIMDVRGGA